MTENKLNLSTLTIPEIIRYGRLGDVQVSSDDWSVFERKLKKVLDEEYQRGYGEGAEEESENWLEYLREM